MSHAGMNPVAGSMTAAIRGSLPRTIHIFSSQSYMSPVHGGLMVLAYPPATPGWRTGMLVMVPTRTRTPTHRCLGAIRTLAAAIPVPGSISAGVMMNTGAAPGGIPKARVVPGPAACIWRTRTPDSSRACRGISSVAGVPLFFTQSGHARSCSLASTFLPGTSPDYMISACSTAAICLHLHPVVWYARPHTGLSLANETRHHMPPCPGGQAPAVPARGPGLAALPVDVEPAARYALLRRPAPPEFPAFHACPGSIDRLRWWMRISRPARVVPYDRGHPVDVGGDGPLAGPEKMLYTPSRVRQVRQHMRTGRTLSGMVHTENLRSAPTRRLRSACRALRALPTGGLFRYLASKNQTAGTICRRSFWAGWRSLTLS